MATEPAPMAIEPLPVLVPGVIPALLNAVAVDTAVDAAD